MPLPTKYDAQTIVDQCKQLFRLLKHVSLEERIEAINQIRIALHKQSPFKHEPVDCVRWVKGDAVAANDYNPNAVAPPEMQLLEHSIREDGYTQPIVAWKTDEGFEVIDGFHRNRVGKESAVVRQRILGYLPLAVINEKRTDKGDRIASTIRHNRARGKHQVNAMSDIVVELKRRNWSTEKICKELGMDQDEVLRLCQITGLAELFADQAFSQSWDVEGEVTEADFEELSDNIETYGEEVKDFRTVNTSDEDRIFHRYEQWECYKAGFYNTTKQGMTKAQCEEIYRELLSDGPRFQSVLEKVIVEWPHSCEHYLTNTAMNRIAWLGQAALCYEHGIPSSFRGGFHLLSPPLQEQANRFALNALNEWLTTHGRPVTSMTDAYSGERQSDIY